jgi:hypothetical protein
MTSSAKPGPDVKPHTRSRISLSFSSQVFIQSWIGIEIVSSNTIYLITTWAIPVIIAITFHEAAHGFVAHRLATTRPGVLDVSV